MKENFSLIKTAVKNFETNLAFLKDKQESVKLHIGAQAYELLVALLASIKKTDFSGKDADEKLNMVKKLAETVRMVMGKEVGTQTNIQINITEEEREAAYERLRRLNAG